MRKELDEALCAKYPKIFRDRYADMRTTAMCWGFDCGDGWYNIIDSACASIQNHIDYAEKRRAFEINSGEPYMPRTAQVPQVVASQIKEKYGTLRFYYSGGDSYVSGVIAMAEYMSGMTCEVCGAPGKVLGGGWVRTLCKTHADEQGYDYSENKEDEL